MFARVFASLGLIQAVVAIRSYSNPPATFQDCVLRYPGSTYWCANEFGESRSLESLAEQNRAQRQSVKDRAEVAAWRT